MPWSLANNAAPPNSTGNKAYPRSNHERISNPGNAITLGIGTSPPRHLFTPHNPTPALPAGPTIPAIPTAETPPWGGFLARVCNECERKLRSEQNGYISGATALPPSSTKWADNPAASVPAEASTCTCEYELAFRQHSVTGRRLCHRHRNKKLRELEKKKDANDDWLRNIMLHPRTGNIVQATPARLNQRCAQVIPFAATAYPPPVPGPAAPPGGALQPMYSPAEVKRFRDTANLKLGRVTLK
ncbi:hypothetical protein LTR27_011509 [Elasticomyces elasticus]|nr:hypothetical protein LTR27_011509 [Elasticomyces elasticus]